MEYPDIPRRNRPERMTPAELAIRAAINEVEKMDSDEKLSQAVILLSDVLTDVSDCVDKQDALALKMMTNGLALQSAIKRIYQASVYQNGDKSQGISLELVGAINDAALEAGLRSSF